MFSMLMITEYPPQERQELQALLCRIAAGEREALAELYRRTRTAVYGLALSYLKMRIPRRTSRRMSTCRCGTAPTSTAPPAPRWAGC